MGVFFLKHGVDKIVTAQCYTLGQVGLRSVMNVYASGKACSARRWDVLLRMDPWPTVVVFDLILMQILFCKLVDHRIRGFNPKKKFVIGIVEKLRVDGN